MSSAVTIAPESPRIRFSSKPRTVRSPPAEAKDDIAFRYLDQIVVKGRKQPVKMFEVLGFTSELPAETADCVEQFRAGMEKYLAQDWDGAAEMFEKAARIEPFQPDNEELEIASNPSLIMLERCPQMKANPPGDDWDGVYVMTSK